MLEDNHGIEEALSGYLASKAEECRVPSLRVFLELTTKCNFRCVHCYNSSCSLKGKELTYSEICLALDQLADMGTLFLRVSGGEALIRNDFWKIIEYARKKEFAILLNSNGSLITSEIAQRLVDLSFFGVVISVYGMDENSYRLITGVRGAFRKVMEAIHELRKKNISFLLKLILLRDNFSQLEPFENMVRELGVESRVNWQMYPRLDCSRAPLRNQLTLQQIKDMLVRHPKYCKPEFSYKKSCSANIVAINSRGDILPCLYFFSTKQLVNIRKKSISHILKKDPIFRRVKSFSLKNIPDCMRCEAAKYCSVCTGHSALFAGGLFLSPVKSKCKIAWLKKKIYEKSIGIE